MKKAFIAAPLLGTFIFLACIAFVVNLSNTEKLASSQAINDAYHNRLVSLLEVYRTDLASIFREGIIRTTEYFLLRQGWTEFDLNQNPTWISEVDWIGGTCENAPGYFGTACAGLGEADCIASSNCGWQASLTSNVIDLDADSSKLSLEELRFVKCDNIRMLTSQVICSLPQTVGAAVGTINYAYGLPQWMAKLNTTLPFEGMTFDVANRKAMSVFLPDVLETDPVVRVASINAYQGNCTAMMKGSAFDCNYFAHHYDVPGESPYRCCKTRVDSNNKIVYPDFDTACLADDVVPGCEDGTFFLNVSLNNSVVYPAMPRLNASDSKGNQLRSGAIGESDFLLPVNYPLFRYYNYALGVYEKLAYGQYGPSLTDEGDKEGVVDGLCGGNDCADPSIGFSNGGFTANYMSPTEAITGLKTVLFNNLLMPACNEYSRPDGVASGSGLTYYVGGNAFHDDVELKISTTGASSDETDYTLCTFITDQSQLTDSAGAYPNNAPCPSGATDTYCGYYQQLGGLKFEFMDYDPAYQVDSEQQNFFRWSASPGYSP
ncbi:MAG: hypothetical protein V1811_02810 [Candidatus Micrarchaeota archaeon]